MREFFFFFFSFSRHHQHIIPSVNTLCQESSGLVDKSLEPEPDLAEPSLFFFLAKFSLATGILEKANDELMEIPHV